MKKFTAILVATFMIISLFSFAVMAKQGTDDTSGASTQTNDQTNTTTTPDQTNNQTNNNEATNQTTQNTQQNQENDDEGRPFGDLDDVPWAQKAIEKLASKGLILGVGQGEYDPDGAVKYVEALIMTLRVMGWEEDAFEEVDLPEEYDGQKVEKWAVSFVAESLERGLVEDTKKFNPHAAAKRQDIAKYIVLALGYDEEALEHMNSLVPFNDLNAIGDGYEGYVYMIKALGIMIGDDEGNFHPKASLTRAEMAVLFDRLDEVVDSIVDENEFRGKLNAFSETEITIQVKGNTHTFPLAVDYLVYLDDEDATYDDLYVNAQVVVNVLDGEVTYIEVVTDDDEDEDEDDEKGKLITKYTGLFVSYSEGDDTLVTIDVDGTEMTFTVVEASELEIDDEDALLSDFIEGEKVKLFADTEDRVRKLEAEREDDEMEYEGTFNSVESVYEDGNDVIYITFTVDEDEMTFPVSEDFELDVEDNDDATLDDLEDGMYIELEIKNGYIVKIEVEDDEDDDDDDDEDDEEDDD